MKKQLLLIITSFLVIGNLQAQNVKKERTTYTYIRKPLKPLDKSIDGVDPKVVFTYEAEVDAKKKAQMNALLDSLASYQRALDDHHRATAKSTSAASLLLSGAPKQPTMASGGYIQKLYDAEEFASSYIKLTGYETGGSNPVTITASVGGFQSQAPVLQTKKTYVKNSDGTRVPVNKYYYQVKYRVPISIKLENKGTVIDEQDLAEFSTYSNANTIEFDNTTALTQYWELYENSFLAQLDENAVRGAMSRLGGVLDNNYGFTRITRNSEIFTVKPKKFDYPEYEEAYVLAIAGFSALSDEANRATANDKLNKAIEWWEKALKDSQPDNKKARIDGKVTAATYVNIAECAIFAQDYTKAQTYISKAKLMKYNKYEREANALKVLLDDEKKRYEANK